MTKVTAPTKQFSEGLLVLTTVRGTQEVAVSNWKDVTLLPPFVLRGFVLL